MNYWLAIVAGILMWCPFLHAQHLARLDVNRITHKQEKMQHMLQRHALGERVKLIGVALALGAGAYALYRLTNTPEAPDEPANDERAKVLDEETMRLQLLMQQARHNEELRTLQGHAGWVIRHAMTAALGALIFAIVNRAGERVWHAVSDGYSRFVYDSGKACLSGVAHHLLRRTMFFRSSYAVLCDLVSSLSYEDALDKKVIHYHIKTLVIDHAAWIDALEDFIAMAHCLLEDVSPDRHNKVTSSLDLLVNHINDVIDRENIVVDAMATEPHGDHARGFAVVLDDVCAELVRSVRSIGMEMYDDWQAPALM